jgi:hypothetical protein
MATELMRVMPVMRVAQRTKAVALVVEVFPGWVGQLPTSWQLAADKALPALGLGTDGLNKDLAKVVANQAFWQQDFAELVRESTALNGLALVGNAAYLHGSFAGEAIDVCGLVVRFNHYARGQELAACVGTKTDVWVVSPAYKGPPPVDLPKWVVVTGPSMEYQLQNWQSVTPLLKQGSKILTVPLKVWRECVKKLQAPPSAGLLVLCWIQQILGGSLTGVRVAGLGNHAAGRPYIAINKQEGSTSRHNWLAEAAWVRSQCRDALLE